MKVDRKKLAELLREIMEPENIITDIDKCALHGRDMAPLPSVALSLFKTLPDAVIKPQSTKEVLDVVKIARSKGLPITPRGAATYGFGGALVTRGGLALDMRCMDKIFEFDPGEDTVIVESGTTWLKLIRYLESRSHTLLSYPSSTPSATVGGWIATGGYGYGSLQHGHIADMIEEMEVVLPSGRVVVSPKEVPLDLFMGTEGTFGIITRVKMRVRHLPAHSISKLISFDDEKGLFDFIAETMSTMRKGLISVPFSMMFFNSTFAALKNKVDGGLEPKPQVLIRFEDERDEVEGSINTIKNILEGRSFWGDESKTGRFEPDSKADHEWDERFFPLAIRKLGPTMLGQDLWIPTEKLSDLNQYLERVSRGKGLELPYEGLIVSPSRAVVMVMMLADEMRKLEYLLSLPILRDLGNEAVKLGGSPYGLGIWNSFYIEDYWNAERANRLREEKARIDAEGIMNPDKVFGARTRFGLPFSKNIYSNSMRLLKTFSPLKAISWKTKVSAQGLEDIVDDLYMCSRCGYCAAVCPVFEDLKKESVALRGEIYRMKRAAEAGAPLPVSSDVYLCTLCGRCKEYCSVRLDTLEIWSALRRCSYNVGTSPQTLQTMVDFMLKNRNPMGMEHEARLDWIDFRKRWNKRLMRRLSEEHVKRLRYSELDKSSLFKEKAETVYFVGCSASYYRRNAGIVEAMTKILGRAEEDFTLLGLEEWCCGEPMLLAGDREGFNEFAAHNLELLRSIGAKRVVFTCAGCYRTFKVDYPRLFGEQLGFEVLHSSEIIGRFLAEGKLDVGEPSFELDRVTYHDPCEIGRHCDVYDPPRKVLSGLGLNVVEMEENRREALCCGGGGLLKAVDQGLESALALRRLSQVESVEAEAVVSGCPSCKMTLSEAAEGRGGISVLDISEITAYMLGILPPEVKKKG